jgi:hypothetical protein
LNSCQKASSDFSEVGFVLGHHYSKATLSPELLKGRDNNLYQIFANSKEFDVELCPIQVDITGRLFGAYKGDSGSDDGICNMKACCLAF